MRTLINGAIYDSTKIPIVIEFDVNEQDLFNGMKKYVSAPTECTIAHREELMNKPLEKLQKDYMRELLQSEMSKTEEIEYWKQLFYNEYEARQHLSETTKEYKKALEEIETSTRNPRVYQPSYYTINHICRESLGLNQSPKISIKPGVSGTPLLD